MGLIIGLVFTFAAIVGLVQYPMAVISEVKFDGDYTPMNLLLLLVALFPALLTFRYGSFVNTTVEEKEDTTTDTQSLAARKKAHMSPGFLLTSPGSELVHSIRNSRRMYNEFDIA